MMSIYHKITKLSIAIISLASLMFNFLFPHVALANNITGNNVLNFDYSKGTSILSYNERNDGIVLVKVADLIVKTNGNNKIYALPTEQTIQIKTLAKKMIAEAGSRDTAQNDDIVIPSADTRDEIAELICTEAGIIDLPCWQDLKAMRQKESYDGKAMVGDNGRSRGWYHIQTKMHKISVECALDFQCSTEWTVNNLITNGYKTNRIYAISRHNGGGEMAKNYAKNVVYNSAKFSR